VTGNWDVSFGCNHGQTGEREGRVSLGSETFRYEWEIRKKAFAVHEKVVIRGLTGAISLKLQSREEGACTPVGGRKGVITKMKDPIYSKRAAPCKDGQKRPPNAEEITR